MSSQEWAVRFRSRGGVFILPGYDERAAHTYARTHGGEVLTRTIPDWTVVRRYEGRNDKARQG